jgi:tRNA(Ile)-lysidine synthase
MSLPERALATIRKHGLIQPGTRVIAAVSGGADSVALALVLGQLAPSHGFTLAGLAHLHHGLRGADADVDAQHVAALAARLGVPLVSARTDVAARAAETGESIEAAARRARYAFLDTAASELRADRVATGHTADDQAETLVLRLMRGAGLQGLSAIRPRNGIVIRPLLDARRAEIERYLRDAGETWRDDATNADRAIARNRVRHAIMPALKDAGGDGVVDALARTAALIQDDAEELERQAIEMARRDVLLDDTGRRLRIAALEKAGPALGRRIVRRALEAVAAGRFLSLEHVEAVRSLIKGDSPASVQVPGAVVWRDGAALRIEPSARDVAAGGFEARLPVPGEVALPGAGMVMSAGHGPLGAEGLAAFGALGVKGDTVALQGVEAAELVVRNRRPGDAIRPLGAPGRRKVQDVFVDRKVARQERDRVPLVVDDRGRIIWVVGHTIADEFRVTSPGARVLLLTVRRAVGDYI